MRSWSVLAGVVAATVLLVGCAGPDTPAEWTAERQTDTDPVEDLSRRLCDDVEAVALGSAAEPTDTDRTLDDLAAIAAVTGVTSALPVIDDLRSGDAGPEVWVEITPALDDATFGWCGVPVVTAMALTDAGSPGWLPCFADGPDGYRPVGCGTDEVLTLVDGDWVPDHAR